MLHGISRLAVLAALVLAALVLAALVLAAGAARAAEGCAVSRQVGTATLLRGASTLPLAPAMAVEPGDHVATGPGARIEITCSDGTTLALGERTTLSLAILADGGGGLRKALLRLVEGIVRIGLPEEKPWSRFDVVTPTAIASARSTVWIVEFAQGDTAVFVARGRVEVGSREHGGAVALDPGQGTDVRDSTLPTPPKRWGQPRIDSAMARTALP
jgi:ferric-dicitrate binding protein FerR (iron transport regulator)